MGAYVGDSCRLRKGRRRREGIRTVSSVGVCRNLVQIVCLQWTVTKLKALSFFRALSSSELARDLKAL